MNFKITYLYIKQHSSTGKLYFGKTTRCLNDLLIYPGSGKHWRSHIKAHGQNDVITLWYQSYDNVFDLVADALSMSKTFDIVNNKSWLNLIPENGLDGGAVGVSRKMSDSTKLKLSIAGKGKKKSNIAKLKLSASISGENHWTNNLGDKPHPHLGMKRSEEGRNNLSKCKFGEMNPMYGKTVTDEVKTKLSLTNSGDNHWSNRFTKEELKLKLSLPQKGKLHIGQLRNIDKWIKIIKIFNSKIEIEHAHNISYERALAKYCSNIFDIHMATIASFFKPKQTLLKEYIYSNFSLKLEY